MSAAFDLTSTMSEQLLRAEPPAAPALDAPFASTFDEVVRVVGVEAAARLVERFGGRRLYVPGVVSRLDLIARAIGVGRARQLSRLFGRDRIDIPADFDHARRRNGIVLLRARGMSIAAIARTLHCTERYVYKVLQKPRASAASGPATPPAERGS